MRAILCSTLTPFIIFYIGSVALAEEQVAFASDNSSAAADTYPHISALENAILGQSFPGQPLTERLGRMEKQAFGKASTNPDLSMRTDALDDYTDKHLHKKLLQADASSETISLADDHSNQNQGDYPHITDLEQIILGHTFAGQRLPDRLTRMEMKAFGAASTNAALSDRTDALDDYTAKHYQDQEKPLHAEANSENINITEDQSSQSQGDYPHITDLEQRILGQTFVGQPLADRLSRMEIKAFGNASSNMALSDRTDALETYAEKKLHKQPAIQQESANDSSAGNSQGSGLLSKVGQTLFNMATGMGGPGIGGIGNGGGMGFGGGGMGFNGGGMGRGSGMNRQAAQQQPETPAPVRQEDPTVYQATPPDSNARLLVKVGWCEVKVFGHTFPSMHLTERLGQLNKELNFEPGKSEVQLMDDIGLMIKAVQSRKQAVPTQVIPTK